MLKQLWVVFVFNCKLAFGARILNSPIMLKMTMLLVLNYHAILLKSGRYIWHVFMQIWYLDKDWNISIFEVEFGNFCKFKRKNQEMF